MKNETATASSVKSAVRVISILQELAEQPLGLTFTELQAAIGIPKSSLFQLISTLERSRMIQFDSVSKRYFLGVRFWELATTYSHNIPVTQIADPYLNQLSKQYDETIQMAILDKADVVYIAKKTSTRPIQIVSQVGMRLPAYVTGIGKALLACLPFEKIMELYRHPTFETYTDTTIATRERLLEELAETKRRGYARDLGEYTKGIRCMAVPVLGYKNSVVAAISMTVLEEPDSAANEELLVKGLLECAQGLSYRLGATNPTEWQKEY